MVFNIFIILFNCFGYKYSSLWEQNDAKIAKIVLNQGEGHEGLRFICVF